MIVSVWISLIIVSLLTVPRLRLVFRRGPLRRRGLSPRTKSAQGRERKEERRWRHHLPGNVPETCQGRRWHQLGKSVCSCISPDLRSICELPEFNSSLLNPNSLWKFDLRVIHECLFLCIHCCPHCIAVSWVNYLVLEDVPFEKKTFAVFLDFVSHCYQNAGVCFKSRMPIYLPMFKKNHRTFLVVCSTKIKNLGRTGGINRTPLQ